jgi:hypothetical protein
VTTDLQWRDNGELHPDELERLQQLLSQQIQGQELEFQALHDVGSLPFGKGIGNC